jgi:hypothetical protein
MVVEVLWWDRDADERVRTQCPQARLLRWTEQTAAAGGTLTHAYIKPAQLCTSLHEIVGPPRFLAGGQGRGIVRSQERLPAAKRSQWRLIRGMGGHLVG